jgi:hypothetical protein
MCLAWVNPGSRAQHCSRKKKEKKTYMTIEKGKIGKVSL